MRLKHKLSLITAVTIGPFLLASPANSQGAQFGTGDINVENAANIVKSGGNLSARFNEGRSIELVESMTKRLYSNAEFQVRIFRIDEGGDAPRSWRSFKTTDGDFCDIYLSSVMTYNSKEVSRGNNSLAFPKFDNAAWLNPNGDKVENGHFLFIFESTEETQPLFRLRRGGKSAYFASALRVDVEVSSGDFGAKEAKKLQDTLDDYVKDIDADIRKTGADIKCYKAKTQAAQVPNGTYLALDETCGDAVEFSAD